jgi:parallel beta-helix repeat protein
MYLQFSLKKFPFRPLILILVIQLSLGLFMFPVNQAKASGPTYYVDNTCTNNGNGTAQTCAASSGGAGPFNSIANAQSAVTGNQAGNSVLLKDGDTFHEQYAIPAYGTSSSSPFMVGSYGTGAQPIIDGANVVASSSWTATTTQSITGTVSQSNMKLSLASGTAFVDFNASGTLTPYTGDEITITDSSGHQLVGWIKAAGSGETYGSQLLPDPGMTNVASYGCTNATAAEVAGQSGNGLQLTLTSAWGDCGQSFTVSTGMTLKGSTYIEQGTDTGGWSTLQFGLNDWSGFTGTSNNAPASWTQWILYGTVPASVTTLYENYSGQTSGKTTLYDTASVTQVLTPSTTGVTIVSSSGGSSYNWTSEQSGFNRDDSGGYTYSVVAPTNVYYIPEVSTSTLGNGTLQMFEDGTRLVQETTGISSLAEGRWYLNTTSSQMWVDTIAGDNPSGHTMEVSVRQNCIGLGQFADYIAVQNIAVRNGGWAGLDFNNYWQALHSISITGVTAEDNYGDGIAVYDDIGGGGYPISNVTISGNTTFGNGGPGIDMWTDGDTITNVSITGNVDHDDVWNPTAAPNSPNGEIHVLATTMSGLTIENNLAYNAGSALPDFKAYPNQYDIGSGIYVDTSPSGTVVAYNELYNNNDSGIILEDTQNAAVYGNISFDNGRAGFTNVRLSSHNVWYNNTAYGNALGFSMWAGGSPSAGGLIDNQFTNNIATGNTVSALGAVDGGQNDGTNGYGNVYAYNDFGPNATNFIQWGASTYYSTLASWQASSTQANNLNANPLFISTSTNNFALVSSSPLIDAGSNLGTNYDLDLNSASTWPANIITDNQNSFGAGWDLGAYVYTQTSAPSIIWLSPSASSTVSSTVTISASSTAVAPASISSVQFYLDGSLLGSPVTSTSSPNTYSYSWNTTGATNASHTLYALATDNYSNTATSTSITVTVANQAVLSVPTSTLSFSAVHGSTATSSQTVIVSNAGSAGTTLNWSASSTQTWLTFSPTSGSLAGNASTSLSFIANPTGLAIGTYNATATIADPNASSSPQYIPVSFTISTTGIGTTLLSPTGGTIATGTISVSATATSTVGIASVQFYLDGSPLGSAVTSSPYTISWDTLTASDGSHTLYSVATDNNSNIASSSEITITVDNSPPAVSITSPTGGATVSGTTSIAASSSDALSGVSSVAFYLDGSLLGESTSSPYSINWDTTQTSNASHNITAVATDDAGNATTSQAISVTVYNAPSVSSGGGGGGGVPQSAFIIVPAATSTTSSTTSASSTASSSLPLVVPTSTASSSLITTSSLQAELNILLAELQSLEAQAGNTTTTVALSPYAFTTDLQLWDTGPAVTALQRYLISEGTGPAATKLNAHGVTQTFGMLTYNALVEFQASVGIHATGYFGPITRAYVNGHE